MEIVYRKLSELHPSPKNPRMGGVEAIKKLAESIKNTPQFFEARPILLSDRTGELVIIAGERRSEAALLLGMEKVPTILIPGLTEAQEDEIMIRDNTHSGKWDVAKLKQWGAALLQTWNVDGVKLAPEVEVSEDNYDFDKTEAAGRVKRGDIYALGSHRLMSGSL